MSVILRHALTGFHYAGPTCWVSGSERAVDLATVERAVEVARKEALGSLEIVAWFDPPGCQLVFPVRFSGIRQGAVQVTRVSAAGGPPGHAGLRREQACESQAPPSRAALVFPSLSFLAAGSEGTNPKSFGHGVSTPSQFPTQGPRSTDSGECSIAA